MPKVHRAKGKRRGTAWLAAERGRSPQQRSAQSSPSTSTPNNNKTSRSSGTINAAARRSSIHSEFEYHEEDEFDFSGDNAAVVRSATKRQIFKPAAAKSPSSSTSMSPSPRRGRRMMSPPPKGSSSPPPKTPPSNHSTSKNNKNNNNDNRKNNSNNRDDDNDVINISIQADPTDQEIAFLKAKVEELQKTLEEIKNNNNKNNSNDKVQEVVEMEKKTHHHLDEQETMTHPENLQPLLAEANQERELLKDQVQKAEAALAALETENKSLQTKLNNVVRAQETSSKETESRLASLEKGMSSQQKEASLPSSLSGEQKGEDNKAGTGGPADTTINDSTTINKNATELLENRLAAAETQIKELQKSLAQQGQLASDAQNKLQDEMASIVHQLKDKDTRIQSLETYIAESALEAKNLKRILLQLRQNQESSSELFTSKRKAQHQQHYLPVHHHQYHPDHGMATTTTNTVRHHQKRARKLIKGRGVSAWLSSYQIHNKTTTGVSEEAST